MPSQGLLKNETFFSFPGLITCGLVLGFSRRGQGNMSLCYGNTGNSLKNRENFLKDSAIDCGSLVCSKQVHSDKIRYVSPVDLGKGAESPDTAIPDTDALITDHKGLPLAIFSADCQVIFLFDQAKKCVGLAHAGWRGTKENIAAKTVEAMKQRFNVKAASLVAVLSPAIRSCCYEVGAEFKDYFPGDTVEREGRLYLDLAGANKRQLLASGLKEANIFDSMTCTSCSNDEFYSYRKEKDLCGRMMSVVMLVS